MPGPQASTGITRPALTWSTQQRSRDERDVVTDWAGQSTPPQAWRDSRGSGVRVCVLDSGVEAGHPLVGDIQGSYAVAPGPDGSVSVTEAEPGDTSGHGTACASIIRGIAPDCEIHSLRVLSRFQGTGDAFITGLRWAVEQGFAVVNLSLSTAKRQYAQALHELADEAYFRGTILVASAHNLPVESYPWRFASVISVGSHAEPDPRLVLYNSKPPVEFFAHGNDVTVGWAGGGCTKVSGNSFATPHISGFCALVLSRCPQLTPFQVKNILYLSSANVRGAHEGEEQPDRCGLGSRW